MGSVLNTLQSTPRCEQLMGNLMKVLQGCTERLARDKPSKNFMASKGALMASIERRLQEDEYQSINVSLPRAK